MVAEGVSGSVTLKLKNVPWDQALAVILKVKGLGMEQRGSIIRVATLAQLQAEEEAEAASVKLREESLPLTTRLIPVNYAVAADMLPMVQGILSPRNGFHRLEQTSSWSTIFATTSRKLNASSAPSTHKRRKS